MKYYILLLVTYVCLVGCSKEPTQEQLELVNQLIQKQIDTPYEEPNFSSAKDTDFRNGETVKEATERNKKLYTDIQDYLVALKNKPYKDKKDWAIRHLELELVQWENAIITLEKSDKENKEIFVLYEQRKKWLAAIKE